LNEGIAPGGLVVSIGTQLRSESGIHPSLHEQIIVRKGTVSTTELEYI
jgi:hypothetical protein